MDPTALVSRERAESGCELLKKLPANGLDVQGALWAQTESDGQPYLYVITPTIDRKGPIEANLLLSRALREFQHGVTDPFKRLDPYEIKLIGVFDPLAQTVLSWYQRHPDDFPTVYRGPAHGPLPSAYFDGYIYPATLFSQSQAQPQAG